MSERTRAKKVAEEIYGARFLSDSHPDEFGVVAAAAAYRRGLEEAAEATMAMRKDNWQDDWRGDGAFDKIARRIRVLADEGVGP